MTQEFAKNQLKELKNYLKMIDDQYDYFKSSFGEDWVENKVHELLDEIQFYKDFLAQFD